MKGSSQSSSSSAAPRTPSTPKGATFGRKKKPASARSHLQDPNAPVSSTSGTNASCSSSISSSIEAPKGCLRFFLPHSSSAKPRTPLSNRSRARPGTPKSAPSQKLKTNPNPPRFGGKLKTLSVSGRVGTDPLKEKEVPKQGDGSCTPVSRIHSGLMTGFEFQCGVNENCDGKLKAFSVSGHVGTDPLKETEVSKPGDGSCTPVCRIHSRSLIGFEFQCGVNENCHGKENRITTPPIEASVSPEMQCSNLKMHSTVKTASGIASPEPCYGAGHVLSGVPDKRKCKPRGILTVIEYDSQSKNVLTNADVADDSSDHGVPGFGKSSGLSPVLMPYEASMHWLSPCYEKGEEDQKDKSPTQGLEGSALMSLFSFSPSLSSTEFSSDVFCKSSLASSATDASSGHSKDHSSALRRSSGGHLLDFKGFPSSAYEMFSPSHMAEIFSSSTLKEGKESGFYVERDDAPFSACSLGSETVIRQLSSDPSSVNPWEEKLNSEANLVAPSFDKARATLSSKHHSHHLSTWDPADLSFRQDYLNTPFNSIDLEQVQKVVDDKAASWVSNTTSDFITSQDPLRISWRDGLVSRIFEMDEYDSCRCFSDEGEGSSKKLNDCPEQSAVIRDSTKLQTEQNVEIDSQVQSMSLDSLGSDGDRLISSEDSAWNLCYKNHLFAP